MKGRGKDNRYANTKQRYNPIISRNKKRTLARQTWQCYKSFFPQGKTTRRRNADKYQVLRDVLRASGFFTSGRNCFWLCPRHRPSLFQGRLCAGRWHLWAGTPPFGWTPWHAGSSYQDPVRPTELPCCSPRRLELAAYRPALNLRQSWTVQRWAEDPSLDIGLRLPLRTFCLTAHTTLTFTVTLTLAQPRHHKGLNNKVIMEIRDVLSTWHFSLHCCSTCCFFSAVFTCNRFSSDGWANSTTGRKLSVSVR